MAIIKTSSTTGKKTVILNDQEWVAQGIMNGWFTNDELKEITSFASSLATDARIKDQLLTKIAYIDDYTQAEQMRRSEAARKGAETRRRNRAAQQAAAAPAAAPAVAPAAPMVAQIRDPRTGMMMRQTPEQMIGSMQRNRFGDAARANYQRLQSMPPAQREAFMSQLQQTPQGRQALTQIAQFEKNVAPGMSRFVQRIDPKTGKPISQLAGLGQDVAAKTRAIGQAVKGTPGQIARVAPQTAQNLSTLGRGVQTVGSGAANVGRMGLQGLGAGPKIMGGPVGIGGLLMGAGGAYLGAKGYQYLRDRSINNQVINQEFLTNPQKVNSALVASSQLRSLQGAKGATNAIDDAIERLNATVLAAINKMNEQSPLAQQVVQQTLQGMQQQRPQQQA